MNRGGGGGGGCLLFCVGHTIECMWCIIMEEARVLVEACYSSFCCQTRVSRQCIRVCELCMAEMY